MSDSDAYVGLGIIIAAFVMSFILQRGLRYDRHISDADFLLLVVVAPVVFTASMFILLFGQPQG